MLSHRAELRDHARRLFEDVGPLHTVSLLGFEEAEKPVVDECIAALAEDARGRFTFLDLRSAGVDSARDGLRPHIADDALVIAVKNDRVPRPIIDFVRAVVDRSYELYLGDYVPILRKKDQSVVLVVEGASTHEALSPELRRIPYEDLIP